MLQKPKGTYDVFGKQSKMILCLENRLKDLMKKYNYQYVRTPLFESSEIFHRGVGETSDIVSKETYDFLDRGNRNMTLRPEGTAGVVRSFIENKMYADNNQPVKLWYYGPMYRYERPQSGRYREFYQFGVETFGSNDPIIDAEVISIPVNFYKSLGLKGIKVNINSLGNTSSRLKYKEALLKYIEPHIDSLCDDCKNRYLKNPLRILDCKVDINNEVLKNAPIILDYLDEESKKHFCLVKKYLTSMGIDYVVNPKIIRGLDYYTDTVFEVVANVEGFGSQNVLCGGGRYNGLVKEFCKESVPAIGFALGFERLLTAIEYENINLIENDNLDIYVIPVTENEKEYTISLVNNLRNEGFSVDTDYLNRGIKSNFKQADRLNAKYIIIIGEEEVKNNVVTIKNNKEKCDEKISIQDISNYIKKNI
ncbi:MAG: histidine--tRNA ligase [Clostridium sp.]|nr:histidine--tRNA ligase [Clostridium sp.]MCM1444737.1 histidine--tRNA ligase [Candidatus Amulumruptor caecigallinarius]